MSINLSNHLFYNSLYLEHISSREVDDVPIENLECLDQDFHEQPASEGMAMTLCHTQYVLPYSTTVFFAHFFSEAAPEIS